MLHRSAPTLVDVPGPRGVPVLGCLVPFARDPLGFVSHVARTWGDLAAYRILEHPMLQVNHPEVVEQVLLTQARSMHKDAIYELLRPLLGNGLVTAEGEPWRRHRKLAAPSFTRKHVRIYAEAMGRCTHAWIRDLPAEGERDLHADMMLITQRIVLDTLFGRDLDVDPEGVAESIDTVMHEFVREVQGPRRLLPRGIPTPGRRRADRAIAALDQQVFALVQARRRAGLGDDLLSRLLAAGDEQGGLEDRELRDEAVTMFVAGHETTALALTYALLLLADHPEADDRLRAEVDEVLGDGPATLDDLPRLEWTAAVVKEAMRVLPPVWAVGREAIEDVEIGGHLVPKGTQLLVAQWVLHRDPRWFDDPEAFRPERWLDGLEKRLPRMAYLPFGGGPRICIGNHFAMLEAVLVLATLARHVRFRPYGRIPPRLVPSITLRPAGSVLAHMTRRSASRVGGSAPVAARAPTHGATRASGPDGAAGSASEARADA